MKSNISIIITSLLLLGLLSADAQIKSRSLGISLQAQTPHAFTADVSSKGVDKGLRPIFKISGKKDEDIWWQYENQKSPSQIRGYSVGAALNYLHSTANFHFISLEGGIRLSRLAYYYESKYPFLTPNVLNEPVERFYEWFYIKEAFASTKFAFAVNYNKSIYYYLKLGGSYAELTEGFFPTKIKDYDGTYQSGTRVWDGNTRELHIDETVNAERVWGTSGGLGIELHFGPRRATVFYFGGILQFYLKEPFVETTYTQYYNNNIEYQDDVIQKGNYIAMDMGIRIPITPARKKNRNFGSSTGPVYTPPSTTPSTTTGPKAGLAKDMETCFKTSNTDMVTYYEKDLRAYSENLEIDFFDADGDNDGDQVSVCVNGNLALDQEELSDLGKVVELNTKGKKEVFIIIYAHNRGNNGKNTVGIQIIKGGENSEVVLELDEDEYYYLRILR